MDKSIFEYLDYKALIVDHLPTLGRGSRTRLAKATHCQSGYVTQVLNGPAHFSLEQAESAAQAFGFSKDHTAYFLNLVNYARAGTPSLRSHYKDAIQAAQNAQLSLKTRLQYQKILSTEEQARFYSSWQYGAIHILVALPEFDNEISISQRLQIPLARAREITEFLIATGLIRRESGHLKIGTSQIHLGDDSAMISKHHGNWRMKAIQSLDNYRPEDLHYSSVMAASQKDALKIREIMTKAIEQIRAIIRESKEEKIYSYAMDLFEI